jgi:hypothetical protein
MTTETEVTVKRCCTCREARRAPVELTPTARFLAIIDRTARPTLSVPPAWSVGQMAGSA